MVRRAAEDGLALRLKQLRWLSLLPTHCALLMKDCLFLMIASTVAMLPTLILAFKQLEILLLTLPAAILLLSIDIAAGGHSLLQP